MFQLRRASPVELQRLQRWLSDVHTATTYCRIPSICPMFQQTNAVPLDTSKSVVAAKLGLKSAFIWAPGWKAGSEADKEGEWNSHGDRVRHIKWLKRDRTKAGMLLKGIWERRSGRGGRQITTWNLIWSPQFVQSLCNKQLNKKTQKSNLFSHLAKLYLPHVVWCLANDVQSFRTFPKWMEPSTAGSV